MGSRHGRNPYLFTLKTNTTIYHCGERDDFDENGTLIPASPKSGKGTRIAIAWAEDIKGAYQPVSASQDVMMLPKPPSPEPGDEVIKPQEVPIEDSGEKVKLYYQFIAYVVFNLFSLYSNKFCYLFVKKNYCLLLLRTSVKFIKYSRMKSLDLVNLVLYMAVK